MQGDYMARPQKEGMDYFPHDTDAVNDEKIEALRLLYGNDGYAFYFILLERIYRSKEFELDVSDAETIQILCRKVGVNEEKFNKILATSIKRGCFDRKAYEERQVLTSNGVKKRASVVVEKRGKMRNKYQQSKENVSDAETTQETEEETPQSKEKKSKEKEKKKESTTTTENPVNLFEQLLCRLSPNQMNSLYQWVDDFNGNQEIVNEAILIADNKNKRYFGFVEFLLKEWANNNLDSLDRVRAYEQEKFNKQKPVKLTTRKKSLFEQGEESKRRQEEAIANHKPLTPEEEKELDELLPF
jgi:DnaD/phage-associated family protein